MSLLNRTTQLRMRRVFRRRQKQVEAVTVASAKHFDRHLIGRFDNLARVRRFALSWLSLVILVTVCTIVQTLALGGYYQTLQPVRGGIYSEGMVGGFSNANPIFATGAVDVAVSKLVFAGLLQYNDRNVLVGNLASGYSVDQTGRHYVLNLKHGLTWQDGKKLTAADVAFTYHLIQNPDVRSPLFSSWQGISVSAPDAYTVKFDLPNAFSAFPYSLTTGILPEHLLAHIPAEKLRSDTFNSTAPVGAGPFAWQALQTIPNTDPDKVVSLIALKPFSGYVAGAPKLDGFVLHAYGSTASMVAAFKKHDLTAMAGLQSVPAGLSGKSSVNTMDFSSTAAVMTFFKTSSGVLAEAPVRQALVQGADTDTILKNLGYASHAVREPLLLGQLAYDAKYQQASFSRTTAAKTLDDAGWKLGKSGVRTKAGQQLTFRLYAEDTPENDKTIKYLTEGWKAIGVNAVPVLQSTTDFQTTLEFHTYDALLYGISIGIDPDVYAYWDSSQADIRSASRLNFSEYKSATADSALEAGRTRSDPALRAIKYKPFLQAWQTDAPALGLYQPRFLYITNGTVYGLNEHALNTDSDRYNSVANWETNTARVTN